MLCRVVLEPIIPATNQVRRSSGKIQERDPWLYNNLQPAERGGVVFAAGLLLRQGYCGILPHIVATHSACGGSPGNICAKIGGGLTKTHRKRI